jgi:kynureninase
VRQDLQARLVSPVWGWLGHAAPFEFAPSYTPAAGIDRFLAGTPPVLSMAAIEPALDLVLEAGLERIRAKSVRQTEYLIERWEAELAPQGFALRSPRESARRGSHVSLGHPEGWRINRALIEEMGVLPDFREPDNLRLGVAPLYTTYAELHEAVDRIARVVRDRLYEKYPAGRSAIT